MAFPWSILSLTIALDHSSYQHHTSGWREISRCQPDVVCVMKYVAAKDDFRDLDVFGVT